VGWNLRIVAALLSLTVISEAQVPAATAVELQQMASHAPVIFAGEVVAVTRQDAAGYVDIRFHIEDGIRGCPQTGFYVLREWGGLWTGQADRYRVGQRRLMLLNARGPAGMSSPVGGLDGAIPLVGTGVAPIAGIPGNAPADTSLVPADLAVDLRWIQARAQRTTLSGSASARLATGNPAKPWPDPTSGDWPGPISPVAPDVATVPPTLASILTLLRGLQARTGSGAPNARF